MQVGLLLPADFFVRLRVSAGALPDIAVDVRVAQTEALLVALAGKAVRGRLFHQIPRDFRHGEPDGDHLHAGQRAERGKVAGGIPVLGAVAHRGLRQVAGARQARAEGLGNVAQDDHPQAGADIDVAFPVGRNAELTLLRGGTELVGRLPKGRVNLPDVHGARMDPQGGADAAAVLNVRLLSVRHHYAVDVFRPEGPGTDRGGHGRILSAGYADDHTPEALTLRQGAYSRDQGVPGQFCLKGILKYFLFLIQISESHPDHPPALFHP